jgi:hypothetical protein
MPVTQVAQAVKVASGGASGAATGAGLEAQAGAAAVAGSSRARAAARAARVTRVQAGVTARGLLCLIYGLCAGPAVDLAARGPGAGLRVAPLASLMVFGVSLTAMAPTFAADWFLRPAENRLRAVFAWAGASLGLGPWVTFFALTARGLAPRPNWIFLPVAFAACWVAGAGAGGALSRAVRGRPPSRGSERVRLARRWTAPLVVLGVATALVIGFLSRWGAGRGAGAPAAVPSAMEALAVDPLGLGLHPLVLFALAWTAAALAVAAVDLARVRVGLGVAAVSLGALLGLAVALARPDALLGWLAGALPQLTG